MNDFTDAAWHQQQLEERQRWEQHRHINREFREWSIKEGYMKTSQMIQSKFLKKEDFPAPEVLTIKGCSIEEVGKGDSRWVLYFNEKTKGIVLNVTKIKQLEAGFGDDSDYWLGKRIKVSNDPTVMMGQQVVGGIKFTLPKAGAPAGQPQPPATPPPPRQPVAASDFDDDSIPF